MPTIPTIPTIPKFDAVFFWLGGVVTDSIPDAIARIVYEQPLARVPIDDRIRLGELSEQLYIGQISSLAFCQRVIDQAKKPVRAEQLQAQIVATVPQHADVLDIADALENYERWLLSDYPAEWTPAVARHLDLYRHFSSEHVLIVPGSGIKRLVPDVFDLLAQTAGKPLQNCLMIDADAMRAVQAVRYKLHSTIHVDARRTRRDLVMRRMLPAPPGFVMPGPRIMR